MLASLVFATALAASPPADPLALLPSLMVGVVGAGEGRTLRLETSAGPRSLAPGEIYQDGWTLTALTESVASFARNGEVRQVGLNPAGAIATPDAPSAPPTIVTLLSDADLSRLDRAKAEGVWDGAALPNLSMAETQRRVLYNTKIQDAGVVGRTRYLGGSPAIVSLLGQTAYNDLIDLALRGGPLPDASLGRAQVYLPAGSNFAAVASAAGMAVTGNIVNDWDAGGQTSTRVSDIEFQVQSDSRITQARAQARVGAASRP